MNHYFLNDEVSSKLSSTDFESAVFMACRKKEPRCYYIKPEDPFKRQIREWSLLNTAHYDQQIISVINKYSNLSKFGGIAHYPEALDSIVKNVLELPFVGDAMHDKCVIKEAIYPGVSVLGVIIMIDERPVEKCYKIQIGHSTSNYQKENTKRNTSGDYLIYISNYFEPNFIYRQVELCNPD